MKIKDVRKVVIDFLKEVFDKDAEIIKISKTEDGWVSEGVIFEESSFIKSIGLPTKVQDRHVYVLNLDENLDVLSYERKKDIEDE